MSFDGSPRRRTGVVQRGTLSGRPVQPREPRLGWTAVMGALLLSGLTVGVPLSHGQNRLSFRIADDRSTELVLLVTRLPQP